MSKPISSSSGAGYNMGNEVSAQASSSQNQNQGRQYSTVTDIEISSTIAKTNQASTESISSNPNYSGFQTRSQYNLSDASQAEGKPTQFQIHNQISQSSSIASFPSLNSLSPRSRLRNLDPMYQELNALKAKINEQLKQLQLPPFISTPTVNQLECQPIHVNFQYKNTEGYVILDENRNEAFNVISAVSTAAELEYLQIPRSILPNGKKIAWLPRFVLLSESEQSFLKETGGIAISVCLISVGNNQETIKDNVPYLYYPKHGIICKVNISVEESGNGPVRTVNKDSFGRAIPLQIAFIDQKKADPFEVLLNAFYPPK